MLSYLSKSGWLYALGILLCSFGLVNSLHAQCDFINDISGLTLSTQPAGDAADPTQYTQVYVLTDEQNRIVATSSTTTFLALSAGNYYVYAANYRNTEAAAVAPLLAVGQTWSGVTAYGDDAANCLDYTAQPYSNCLLTVCEQQPVCEFFTLNLPANGFNGGAGYTQVYALVGNGTVLAVQASSTFNLNSYPVLTSGVAAQVFAINYLTSEGVPVAVGDNWNAATADVCTGACYDFIGMDLLLQPVSLASGNGISTTVDWWDTSDACAGAQPASNGGLPVSATLNNWCVPTYDPAAIQARPLSEDDLLQYMSAQSLGMISRVPCVGAMDLTQNTVFYTVECAPGGPSDLVVEVANPGADITRIEAALYGPVNALCPTITGGTFIDCEDAGAGSLSGAPVGTPLILNASNTQPGQVYLVIIDTEGREQFTVNVNPILLGAKLLAFAGSMDGAHNVLNWSVEQDRETESFTVQRSLNGADFADIAQINPHNNGQNSNSYQFVDQFVGYGTKYYRLRVENKDASSEHSAVVALTHAQDATQTNVSIFPNPNTGNFTIEFSAQQNGSAKYEIRDLLGRMVHFGERATSSGINRFELSISDLPAATYIVTLHLGGTKIHRRVVKK